MSPPGVPVVDRLVEGLRSGSVVSFSDSTSELVLEWVDGATAVDVDASLVRDLLRGKTVGDPDPRGLWLRGARILGRLDLEYVEAVCR